MTQCWFCRNREEDDDDDGYEVRMWRRYEQIALYVPRCARCRRLRKFTGIVCGGVSCVSFVWGWAFFLHLFYSLGLNHGIAGFLAPIVGFLLAAINGITTYYTFRYIYPPLTESAENHPGVLEKLNEGFGLAAPAERSGARDATPRKR